MRTLSLIRIHTQLMIRNNIMATHTHTDTTYMLAHGADNTNIRPATHIITRTNTKPYATTNEIANKIVDNHTTYTDA